MRSSERRNLPRPPIYRAEILQKAPWFAGPPATRGRKALGVRYEELVHREFLQRYPGYLASMWIRFEDREGEKYCQPDGLLVNPWQGILTIIEVKYQHTNAAYYQMFDLYLPVLQVIFGGCYQLACCEVVKWYDAAIYTDVPAALCRHPDLASPGLFNVHIWRP